MSFRNEATETTKAGCLMWILGGMVGLLILGFAVVQTGMYYAAMPWLRQQETAINRSSQGYVETRQAVLLKLTQDAYRLQAEIDQGRAKGEDVRSREAQLKASLDDIEREASTIESSQVPGPTRDLMARHGRAL